MLEIASVTVETINQDRRDSQPVSNEETYAYTSPEFEGNDVTAGDARGDNREEKSLVTELQEQARDDLQNWAVASGILKQQSQTNENAEGVNPSETNPDVNEADQRPKPLAFVADALGAEDSAGWNLLEALILGAGALYGIDKKTGGAISTWAKKLLPRGSGWLAGGARYEKIMVIFLMENLDKGLPRIVAAKVEEERLEVVAEQIFPPVTRSRGIKRKRPEGRSKKDHGESKRSIKQAA